MHDELIRAIAEWNPNHDGPVGRDTPLITSARIDSLGLLRMITWMEDQIGRPIDASTHDMAAEWDTVDAVVAFVERERAPR